jgi:hypothetical protein
MYNNQQGEKMNLYNKLRMSDKFDDNTWLMVSQNSMAIGRVELWLKKHDINHDRFMKLSKKRIVNTILNHKHYGDNVMCA